jgi:hypothetical protein
MVNDRLEAVKVCFDDERSVAGAGVLLVATLAQRLGLGQLIGECVRLGQRGARFRPGRKVLSLVFAIVLGVDSIDGCDVLRSGRTRRLLGVRVMAPSTLGRFCGRSRSGTCAGSTACSARRSGGRGAPARAPARGGW